MVRGDHSHFSGQREIKIENTTLGAVASLIVDETIRTHFPPGMCAVYLFKLLIHIGRNYEKATQGVLELNRPRVNQYFSVDIVSTMNQQACSDPLAAHAT